MTEEMKPAGLLALLGKMQAEEGAKAEAECITRQERGQAQARRAAQDGLFVDLATLTYSFARKYEKQIGVSHRAVFELIQGEGIELFCRWLDPAAPYHPDCVLWASLPPGPVSSVLAHDSCLVDNRYLMPPTGGSSDVSDPVKAAQFMLESGVLPRDLAVRRKDALSVFDLGDHDLKDRTNAAPVIAPAAAAVQSEPTPAPEQPAEPVWKDGDHWTPAAVAEMVRLHEQEGRSLSDIGRVMGDRVGGPAISRQRVREKIPDSVRGGKGKCKGARG